MPECEFGEFEYDFEYWVWPGHDLHFEHDVQSAENCFELCKEFPGCYGFSWYNPYYPYYPKTCWLRGANQLHIKYHAPNVVSCKLNMPELPKHVDEDFPEDCKTEHPHWFHDKYCDDDLNNEQCDFDGGDCCLDTEIYGVSHDYCDDCQCIMEDPDYASGNDTDFMEWTQDSWNSTNEEILSLIDLFFPEGLPPSPSPGGVTSITPGPTTTPAPSPPMVSSGVSEGNVTAYNATSIIRMLLARAKK